MTTAREQQAANQALAKLAQRDLMGFWYGLGTDDPLVLKAALLDFMPDLISTYGSAAAGLAADRYDELRADSIASGAFRAALAPPLPDEQVHAVTRWALGPAFKDDPAAALTMLTDATQRLVRQQARNTVALNVERDPFGASYARVPKGKTTCAFCLMLASRGAVYGSKKSAETIRNSGKHYHTKCDCEAEPVWSGDDLERLKEQSDYDPDSLYEQYAAVHETGMTGKQAAAALRQAYDLK